jgi:hypothetical protein
MTEKERPQKLDPIKQDWFNFIDELEALVESAPAESDTVTVITFAAF